MRAVRETLVEHGREMMAGLLAQRVDIKEALTVLLIGSGTTEFADAYSGWDFLMVCPDEWHARVAAAFKAPAEPGAVFRARTGGATLRLRLHPRTEMLRRIEEYDDSALFALRNALILHDPQGTGADLVERAGRVPSEVWLEKAQAGYREFRRRKASLAWALRRGQPFLVLENLVQVLENALAVSCFLAGMAPPGRKWLFQAAMRTPAGQEMRPGVFELFSSLGGMATLGGSLNLNDNHLYRLVTDLQRVLEEALERRVRERS